MSRLLLDVRHDDKPTKAQAKVLRCCPIDGTIELSLDTGLTGAALTATVGACKRRGWIGGDGWITEDGERALVRAQGGTP